MRKAFAVIFSSATQEGSVFTVLSSYLVKKRRKKYCNIETLQWHITHSMNYTVTRVKSVGKTMELGKPLGVSIWALQPMGVSIWALQPMGVSIWALQPMGVSTSPYPQGQEGILTCQLPPLFAPSPPLEAKVPWLGKWGEFQEIVGSTRKSSKGLSELARVSHWLCYCACCISY